MEPFFLLNFDYL